MRGLTMWAFKMRVAIESTGPIAIHVGFKMPQIHIDVLFIYTYYTYTCIDVDKVFRSGFRRLDSDWIM